MQKNLPLQLHLRLVVKALQSLAVVESRHLPLLDPVHRGLAAMERRRKRLFGESRIFQQEFDDFLEHGDANGIA